MATMYAAFADADQAEKATGALLDHGALPQDVAILANEQHQRFLQHDGESALAESNAKSGITTTTGEDAAYGAMKGSLVGLGVGTLAAIAAVTIPGFGIVLGGGAMAMAAAGAFSSAAAGAAAGGVVGFLKDQGVGETYVAHYSEAINAGGTLLSVDVPTGDLSEIEVEQLLAKYGAYHISTNGGDSPLMERAEQPEPLPTAAAPKAVVVDEVVTPVTPTTLNSVPVGDAVVALEDVRPTRVNPVTGAMEEGVAIDPLTGFERPVVIRNGAPQFVQVSEPVATGFTLADVVATSYDPATGEPAEGTVRDPITGAQRSVRVVNGSIIYADLPRTDV